MGVMLLEFASPILLFLILLHAMVGYVELGTDSWITNITGTILASSNYGLMLFIWTSGLMFILRFFAGPIVHKISPLGLLFCAAVLGCIGLMLLGQFFDSFTGLNALWFLLIAATIYGCGKTFFWPTMLGVVSERFPKGGALTLGVVGGVGMLSVGLLGGPIIGYEQDYFAKQSLESSSSAAYTRYSAEKTDSYLFLPRDQGTGQRQGRHAPRRPGEEQRQRAEARRRHQEPGSQEGRPRQVQGLDGPRQLVARRVRPRGVQKAGCDRKSRGAAARRCATPRRTRGRSRKPSFTAGKWR